MQHVRQHRLTHHCEHGEAKFSLSSSSAIRAKSPPAAAGSSICKAGNAAAQSRPRLLPDDKTVRSYLQCSARARQTLCMKVSRAVNALAA